MSGGPAIRVMDLGRREYGETLALQREIVRERLAGEAVDDVLLLVEHDPVVTLGRGTRQTSLPIPPEQMREHGIAVFEVERGGDVTYHGPGQLVGYPILNLERFKPDLHWYLRRLEQVLIDGLATLDVPSARVPGLTGVWAGPRKIASIGVHVKRWITLHGFALNVSNDLTPFRLIVPCGIDGVDMTSVARERELTGDAAGLLDYQARDAVVQAFGAAFDRVMIPVASASLGASPRPR